MTIMNSNTLAASGTRKPPNGFRFEVADITGTHVVDVTDVDRGTPVGAVASALAARLALPQNTPWALREDRHGNYLDDQRTIGEQVENEARLTLHPKAHLG